MEKDNAKGQMDGEADFTGVQFVLVRIAAHVYTPLMVGRDDAVVDATPVHLQNVRFFAFTHL